METHVELPVEIVFQILEWGFSTSHKFSLSISLVCKEFRKLALPHVFNTVFISRTKYDLLNNHFFPHASLVHNIWFDPGPPIAPHQGHVSNQIPIPACAFLHLRFLQNITHIAIRDSSSLAAIDCDCESHARWELSNLKHCHSLTLFDRSHYIRPNQDLESSRFLAENITHIQVFLSSSTTSTGCETLLEIVDHRCVLTHLAITPPIGELVLGQRDNLETMVSEYWMALVVTKRMKLAVSRNPTMELFVLMIDWSQWMKNYPGNVDIARRKFKELVSFARTRADDQMSMSIVPWNMQGGSRADAVRHLWMEQVSSGVETVWDRALWSVDRWDQYI
ncbi:hypothetical protein JAAARDRAFT_314671 [Jaapia argillacea MUCL 33604]|uniref:F-box domain-containing protein n=1 Tax=Jaapia argillacea MUCL 33604 TaxID=933084 RepID=A0A067PMC9_9AGAM|nr:hypothetical protein JAAARDRAFT_314671 [Jaapia argillacea MUCL 33604]